LHIIYYL